MMRPVSTIQLEHGMPLLAELDLAPLFEAMAAFGPMAGPEDLAEGVKVTPDRLRDLVPVLQTLGKAGEARLVRRLVAVARATDDELEAAEGNPKTLAALHSAAARLPVMESLVVIFGFFARLGLSPSLSPVSLEEEGEARTEARAEGAPAQGGDTPSGDS